MLLVLFAGADLAEHGLEGCVVMEDYTLIDLTLFNDPLAFPDLLTLPDLFTLCHLLLYQFPILS